MSKSTPPPTPTPPAPGQESVWTYPRPPRLEPTRKHIEVIFDGVTIADTRRAWRVLETGHAPVYYVPPEDVRMEYFERTSRRSVCEFKGTATYYTITHGDRIADHAAWAYLHPTPPYAHIAGHIAFYPQQMDACLVDGEPARSQPGSFYGGWITDDIAGPFKGDPPAEDAD
jgi:uncharacterized protein (DUF427 family)